MAKDSGKKKKKQKKEGKAAPASPKQVAEVQESAPEKRSKIGKAVKKARSVASKASDNPLVTEVVAAALVATAAAIKDPKTARKLAAAAGSDLKDAGAKSGRKAEIFWNLALDVARRSLESMNADKEGKPSAPKTGNE